MTTLDLIVDSMLDKERERVEHEAFEIEIAMNQQSLHQQSPWMTRTR